MNKRSLKQATFSRFCKSPDVSCLAVYRIKTLTGKTFEIYFKGLSFFLDKIVRQRKKAGKVYRV